MFNSHKEALMKRRNAKGSSLFGQISDQYSNQTAEGNVGEDNRENNGENAPEREEPMSAIDQNELVGGDIAEVPGTVGVTIPDEPNSDQENNAEDDAMPDLEDDQDSFNPLEISYLQGHGVIKRKKK